VDVDKIKAELRAEVTQDILSMLASQGIQLQPFSRGPSPTLGRRSSCASASAADIHPKVDPDLVEPNFDASCFDDTIDRLTEPTPCSLVTTVGGYQMEVAKGLVYPQQTILHSVPILFGYAVVKVEISVTRILLGGGVSISDTYRIRICPGYVSSRILKKWIHICLDTRIRYFWARWDTTQSSNQPTQMLFW